MPERVIRKGPEVIAAQRQTAKLFMAFQAGKVERTRFGISSSRLPQAADYENNQKLLDSYREVRGMASDLLHHQPLTSERLTNQVQLEQEAVRRTILESLNQSNFFTPETIDQAAQSDAAFTSIMRILVTQHPQITSVIPDILYVTVPQEFKQGLQSFQAEDDIRFYMSFGDLARFYTAEEVKDVMMQMMEHPSFVISTFFSPDVQKHYMQDGIPSEEGKALLRQAVQKDPGEIAGQQLVDRVIEEGFLTPKEIQEAVISFVDREVPPFMEKIMVSRKVRAAAQFLKYFSGEPLQQLQEQVRALALQNLSVAEVYRNAELLGQDGEQIIQTVKEKFLADLFSGEERKNGFDDIRYLREELSELSPSVVETYIHRYKILTSFQDVIFLLEKHAISPDEKKKIAHALFVDLPTAEAEGLYYFQASRVGEVLIGSGAAMYSSVNVLHELLTAYTPKKKDQAGVVKKLVLSATSNSVLGTIDQWVGYIPSGERKEFIREYIVSQEGSCFKLVSEYIQKPEGILAKLFTREDVLTLVRQAGIGGLEGFSQLADVRSLFADDKEFRAFLLAAGDKDPERFISSVLGQAGDVFTTDEVKDFIMTFSQNHEGVAAELFESIDGWAMLFMVNGDEAFVQKFVEENKLRAGEKIIENLHKIIRFIDESHRDQFIRDAIALNPAKAVQLYLVNDRAMEQGLSYEQIIEIGAEAMEGYAKKYAPKTLTEFYSKLRTMGDSPARQALLTNTEEVYGAIARIRAFGLEDIFFSAQEGTQALDGRQLTAGVERELLFVFETYTQFMKQDPSRFTVDFARNMKSLDFAVDVLVAEIGRDILGKIPTGDELYNFHQSIDNPMALLVYYMKYSTINSHKDMLHTMMQALFSGKDAYEAWRFGEPTTEGFEEARSFLPKNMTPEQYLIWRKERKTLLTDILATSAADVSTAVNTLMRMKRKHLRFAQGEGLALPFDQASLASLQAVIQQNGQELARVNKELGQLRRQSPDSEQLAVLEQERESLMVQRDALAHNKKIMRLALITPEEIVSGHLLEGEKKSKGASLTSLLAELKHAEETYGTQEGVLAYSEIEQYFLEYTQQTGEAVNLEAFDTSDLQLTMEIGRKPVGSCQDFAHGAYNQCLVGYTNHNVKPMFLAISGRDSLVARNIERVLDTSDGQVGLHMERIYSASASPLIHVAMYEHAMRIAEEMGVELYTSSFSQDEEGIAVAAVAPKGFRYEPMPADFYLVSPETSRAPWQYVDSGGGPRQGQFKLPKLYKIVREGQSRSARRG